MSETASIELLWIGRFTGPKGELAEQIISQIAPEYPEVRFTMVGGPVNDALSASAPANVELTGFVADIQPYLQRATAVIGAGRVALEAMQARKPILAVGENNYHGWIDEKNIDAAKATNFGDCSQYHKVDMIQFSQDINQFIKGKINLPIESYVDFLSDYEPERVYQSVMDVYRISSIDTYLRRFKEIPILTYHRVVKTLPIDSLINMYVTVDEMESQIISLHKRGFETMTFKDIAEGVQVKKPVILTFDDGYLDNYENLLPLLRKHNAKVVIFALANRELSNNEWDIKQGEPEWPLMNNEQLKECVGSGHVEIGSHGMNHQHLSQLDDIRSKYEIIESKNVLENLLGTEVVSFAYPYGDYSDRDTDFVKESGYLFGIGTVNGPLKSVDDRYRIRRITMFPGTSTTGFRKKTSGWYLRYCKLKGKDF